MPRITLNDARRDAGSICSKAECNIVHKSADEEVKLLSPEELREQIKLSHEYFVKHQGSFKTGKSNKLDAVAQHHIELKMNLMEDAEKRFKKQLKKLQTKKGRAQAKQEHPMMKPV